MPVICRLPGGSGSGSGSGGTSDLSLNIFTQPDEPEMKDGLWIQRANSHKKIVVDNLISSSGEWSAINTAPFSFDTTARPILLNGKIITFDSSGRLWEFNGSTWTAIYDNPDSITGVLCAINNQLYCVSNWAALDSSYEKWGPALFKWNGSALTKVINIACSDNDTLEVSSCVVHGGYIYVFKSVSNINTGVISTQLMRSNGSSFSSVATVNYYIVSRGFGISFNSKIYWIGGYFNNTNTVEVDPCVITSTGSNISLPSANNTPFSGSGVGWTQDVFDNVIHAIVTLSAGIYKHYTFDGSTWTKLFDMDVPNYTFMCAYSTRLYAMGSNQFMYYSKTHDKYPEHTLILQIADTHDGPYETSLVNTSELVTNGRFVTKFNDVFFVGESGLETTDPIYYGDGSKWVKFKN